MNLASTSWSFEEIARTLPNRAASLESAPPFDVLADSVIDALSTGLKTRDVCLAVEEAERDAADVRAVVQFRIGEELFDQFFNSRTGYRASFRAGRGMESNASVIRKIRDHLERGLDAKITVVRLDRSFEFKRTEVIARRDFLDSLEPDLSKLWMCGQRVQMSGSVERLALGLTGPRILLGSCLSWPAPFPHDSDAWVDVKGAFLGRDGLYQPKDPHARAQALATTGEPG